MEQHSIVCSTEAMTTNGTDTKWPSKMFITCAICLDLSLLSCLLIMPIFKFLEGCLKFLILLIINWFRSMSSLFRHWKNRLRCSNKRFLHQSRSSIFADSESKTVQVTMEKLLTENRLLKDRFDKLEERCQHWIADEQIYLLKRIEQLESENQRSTETYRLYQRQSEKCLASVTDLIIKTLFTQEELRKQCADLRDVQLRTKLDQKETHLRSISCQFDSSSSNVGTHRHTTNDQSTWLHQQLMIVEENDSERRNAPLVQRRRKQSIHIFRDIVRNGINQDYDQAYYLLNHSFTLEFHFLNEGDPSMVLREEQMLEPDPAQYYYGDCESLLANCCSKSPLVSPFKFRTMNRQRRQMAFDMLRQMKSQSQYQHSKDILSNNSKRRRNKKRFYRAFCCTELHITGSHSSIYSPTMAAAKHQSHVSPAGLTNELYFSSHKPDGDNEKTPPVLMRNKRRSPHLNSTSMAANTTPILTSSRRPISSPVRSNTYVLQQHHRLPNNQPSTNKKKPSVSPVHHQQQPSSSSTPMTLHKTRQTQQQRTYSNHERLPIQTPSTVNSITTHQQVTRRTSPIVKSTPTKTTPAYISRSPRIPNTPAIRPSRPTAPLPPPASSSALQPRSPRLPFRSPHLTPRKISSSPATNRSLRVASSTSKSPEPLRSISGAVTRPRPAHTLVNHSKPTTPKKRIPIAVQSNSSTPRVSDLDALMAEKQIHRDATPPISIPPAKNICRSLFSPASVKVVRPVRSQELKIFSCHLTTEDPPSSTSPPNSIKDISSSANIDETHSTLTPISTDESKMAKQEDSPSNTSAIVRDLSEDSLNSLNEHYHIRQLLKNNVSITATRDDSSNEDLLENSGVTSWSRIRSSCESDVSHVPPLKSASSTSPAFYNGPIRQENLQMASDGRYFLLIDDNLSSSNESQLNRHQSPFLSQSLSSLLKISLTPNERKVLNHRLVFPSRLGRIIFYRRVLSETDIYQKLCSKEQEIQHNVYHLDTIRDYAMEFYMLTTYGSDSQLRAWFDSNCEDIGAANNCYFDDNRFQSLDDDDDDENRMKVLSSSDSILREEDLTRLQADEELDWYSELESFHLSSNNPQWKQENISSCSSEDQVGELLRAEQFSVSSLTTTTSADSSSSTDLTSASWPLTNGIHYHVHSNGSSQSLGSPPSSHIEEQSNTILKEILTYPWANDLPTSHSAETENDNMPSTSVVAEEFQRDFYYLCPLKNTTSFAKTDDQSNGLSRQYSHDV